MTSKDDDADLKIADFGFAVECADESLTARYVYINIYIYMYTYIHICIYNTFDSSVPINVIKNIFIYTHISIYIYIYIML
jgi:hypothetical protein